VRLAYLRRVERPPHVPKPQLTFVHALHALHALPGYVPSPAETVITLFGERYAEVELDEAQRERQRARDRDELLAHASFVRALPPRALPLRAIDRPGLYLERILHELPWRVAPVAPRVLSLAGGAYEEVWTLNRTGLVAALRERGLGELAETYATYYGAGWRVFLSGEGVPDAVRAGVAALRAGIAIAEGAAPDAPVPLDPGVTLAP